MRSFIAEFKVFTNLGNLLALAVAFVIGAAVTSTINALVESVIMPIVAIPCGEVNLVPIAITVFWMMTAYNRVVRAPDGPNSETAVRPLSHSGGWSLVERDKDWA